jgi:hypothetical protein
VCVSILGSILSILFTIVLTHNVPIKDGYLLYTMAESLPKLGLIQSLNKSKLWVHGWGWELCGVLIPPTHMQRNLI